jgi:hypothetical protein
MGWLDGDINLGDYDWGGSGGTSIGDIPTGGYAQPDVSWGYGNTPDWAPTVTDYGDQTVNDINYNPTFPDMTGGGGGGALSFTQPQQSAIGQQTLQSNDAYNPGSPSAKEIAEAGGKEPGLMDKVVKQGKGLLLDKEGELDLSKMVKLISTLGGVYGAYSQSKKAPATSPGAMTPQQLQAQLVQNKSNDWTPQQAVWANRFFQTPNARSQGQAPQLARAGEGGIKSIMPSRGYAAGGTVGGQDITDLIEALQGQAGGDGVIPTVALAQLLGLPEATPRVRVHGGNDMAEGGEIESPMEDQAEGGVEEPTGPLSHGDFGLVAGAGDGQSDSVPINAAAGEYVFDAETVSMLGNGSNEAGAQILDQWREFLREHKRDAPPGEIGPPSKDPNEYLPEIPDTGEQ